MQRTVGSHRGCRAGDHVPSFQLLTLLSVTLLLGLGWLVHLLSWGHAMTVVGRQAADRDEWLREALIRISMLVLIVYSLVAPSMNLVSVPRVLAVLCVLLFWGGHAISVMARLELKRAWGIGTRARSTEKAVSGGVYRYVGHPIYLGTFTALLMQTMLLQNVPSMLLLAAAAVIIPWKIAREGRWIRTAR